MFVVLLVSVSVAVLCCHQSSYVILCSHVICTFAVHFTWHLPSFSCYFGMLALDGLFCADLPLRNYSSIRYATILT